VKVVSPPTSPKISSSTSVGSVGAARVEQRRALRYDDGADVHTDRPAHVRAGSGCATITIPGLGRHLAVVQDDANFIALVQLDGAGRSAGGSGRVRQLTLPAGAGGLRQFDSSRSNKAAKFDLESIASLTVDGAPAVLCMGSGSTAAREVFVLARFPGGAEPAVEVFAAGAFFKGLAATRAFAGDEMNIEGMVIDADSQGVERVRFFNRGNGAGEASDAIAEVPLAALLQHLRDPLLHAAPRPRQVHSVDLGTVDGTRLTFTDATRHPDGRTIFIAAAEASPNTYDDGVVKGCALGVLGDDGRVQQLVPILDEGGRPLTDKVEGIAIDPTDPTRAFVVVDKDDPTAPAELLVVRLPAP
jgi:hypothetical protein